MTTSCPNCSYDCPPDFAFCPKCGTSLKQTCPQCQAQSPSDFAFCPKCGTKLGAPAPTPAMPPARPPDPVPAPVPVAPSPPTIPADPLAERLKRLVPKGYADKLLANHGRVEAERRVVTILFSDISGSTALSETMDPEDVMEIMDDAFDVLIEPVYRHEGTLARLMGDAILAFFGAPVSHEDDPIRACRTALDIVKGAKEFSARLERERGISGFNVRVGINTGLVVVGEVGTDLRVEYTAMGDAINLASRMESSAPPGGIMITNNTYRYIEGIFDCTTLNPITVKGKSEPIQVYLVERERPRTFQAPGRGIQGVAVPLIGRGQELQTLKDGFQTTVTQHHPQTITLVAEAGVGKSRLLREFDLWLDQQAPQPARFVGRAEAAMQYLPFALLRDIFTFHCHIQANDSPAEACQKFVDGVTEILGREESDVTAVQNKAHFIGQLLGFDFSASPHIQKLLNDPRQIYDRALVYLVDFFKAAATPTPLVILLEDIHWADESSLDILNQLVPALSEQPLFLLCAARPNFFERQPNWGKGRANYQQLRLHRLTEDETKQLVLEILSGIDQVPDHLQQLIINGAEGNPYYVEELVKMLIEDDVISQENGRWQVQMDQLDGIRIPPTLTGVLQARLDALPPNERETLQGASVVGRTFWDEAVSTLVPATTVHIDTEDHKEIHHRLSALQNREIVFEQSESAMADMLAYCFKHSIFRDVTYESVLKRRRRRYHAQIAEWLKNLSEQRNGQYAGQIGEHLELARKTAEAAAYFNQAGQQAANQYANAEAINYFTRALNLTPTEDLLDRYNLLLSREKVYDTRGQREAQRQDLTALEETAHKLGDPARQAEVMLRLANFGDVTGNHPAAIKAAQQAVELGQTNSDFHNQAVGHWFWGRSHWRQGEYEPAQLHLDQALTLARQHNLDQVEADSLRNLGSLARHQGRYNEAADYNQQALNIYREMEDQAGESATLQNLGIIARNQGDYSAARSHYEAAMQISKTIGNRLDESDVLTNLGVATMYQSDYVSARSYFDQARRIKQEIDDRHGEGMVLGNLGIVARNQGALNAAVQYFEDAADRYQELGYQQPECLAQANLGLLHHYLGDNETAVTTSRQAVQMSRAIGSRHIEAEALTYLGHSQLALEHLGEAAVSYQAALKIRRDLEQPKMATESQAGLAAVSLNRQEIQQALAYVEEILAYLADNSLDGTDEPFRVYLTCYQVLAAAEDGRSQQILETAVQKLQEQAANISDPTLRRAFLEDIPIHRQLLQAWNTLS